MLPDLDGSCALVFVQKIMSDRLTAKIAITLRIGLPLVSICSAFEAAGVVTVYIFNIHSIHTWLRCASY